MILEQSFITTARSFLLEYRKKIEACFDRLNDEDIWWRPNEESNSIGNLLLHVSGSIRHWIVAGIGGNPVNRVRQEEFDERRLIPKEELLARLETAVREVDEVLARIDPSQLLKEFEIFGEGRTQLFAIFHMIEHFSMHTGQILMITKMRTAKDLGLA